MNRKQITLTGLLLILGLCLFTPWFLNAQDAPKKPNYSAYYLHRVSHFRALPKSKNDIIFLGDSITDGAEWVELTGNTNAKNRGISGDVTEGVLYRLDEVTQGEPAKVFIMIGVNDLATGLTVDKICENYSKIIDFIKEKSPKTKILIQSVLPVNDTFTGFKTHTNKTDQIIELNGRLSKIADEKGCAFIDFFNQFAVDKKLNKEFTGDGLHLNGEGYKLWFTLIKDRLK